MSNTAQISDTENVKRFEDQTHDGPDIAVKRAAAADRKSCKWSREQVSLELSRVLGREVTVPQIDAMVCESKTHRLPISILPAWIQVTGSTRILELLCAQSGMTLASESDQQFAELGRAALAAEKLAARSAELKEALWAKA